MHFVEYTFLLMVIEVISFSKILERHNNFMELDFLVRDSPYNLGVQGLKLASVHWDRFCFSSGRQINGPFIESPVEPC